MLFCIVSHKRQRIDTMNFNWKKRYLQYFNLVAQKASDWKHNSYKQSFWKTSMLDTEIQICKTYGSQLFMEKATLNCPLQKSVQNWTKISSLSP